MPAGVAERTCIGADAGGANSILHVKSGSVLNVLGNVNHSNGNGSAAFMLAHWSSTGTVNVEGVLNVLNANISICDGSGVLNINDGGFFNIKGLNLAARRGMNGGAGALTVNLNPGGTINIGTDGINTTCQPRTKIAKIATSPFLTTSKRSNHA